MFIEILNYLCKKIKFSGLIGVDKIYYVQKTYTMSIYVCHYNYGNEIDMIEQIAIRIG